MKKFSKKVLCIILSVVIALGSLVTASLASDKNGDGIVIKVSSDKKYYTKGEDIVLDVEVTNTTDEDMSDVDINMDCNWFNFDVEEGSSIKIKELKAGETKTIQFHAKYLRLDLFEFISVMFKRVAAWFNRIILGTNSETTRYSVRVNLIKRTFVFSADVSVNTDTNKTYTVTFDYNYEGAPEAKTQTVKAGEYADVPADPENNDLQFMGWYADKNDTDFNNYYDFTEPVTDNIILFAKWLDVNDTDGEGLVDGLEDVYGTDKTLVDTDGDKISDYDEIILGLDPLLTDSDNNGVADGDEDMDLDGLSYFEEKEIGTDPTTSDTDYDGLHDGEEVDTYGTDPTKEDTDEDEVSDGKEIELGTDPLVAQAIFNINLSANDVDDTVTPSVKIDLSGEQVETLSIDPFEDDNFFPESMPGYIGKAYDFTVEGEFSSATISFEFDESMLDDGAEPVICYFNEENQELEELETTITGNVASTTVTHFSKYILIDRKVYQDSFTWQDVWDSEQTYTDVEVVFVIDDSGSMSSNDRYNQRLSVASDLIDKLPQDSKVGIVKFTSSVYLLTTALTQNKEAAKSYLTSAYFGSSGGTSMYYGIQKAFPLYESDTDTTLKMMIVLSDGETDDTYLHSSVITTANESNIRIYTVGLGSSTSYFNSYLKPLANNTGATFYLASNAAQLADIYKDISERIDIETDSDDDGVPDYYEDNMICFNGVKLALDKNNPDTDGDGLKDGEEVELKYDYNADKTQVKVTGKLVLGNPTKVDSDDDSYDDYKDLSSFEPYKTPIILLHGWNSNSTCFGVTTAIANGDNTHYDKDKNGLTDDSSISDKNYRLPASHKITNEAFDKNKLGKYLENIGYERNKNLYAFNYPNQDMVQYNARKLSGYVANLVALAKENTDLSVTDPNHLFATKEDYENDNVKFILIGHSMGGLVSRYYVENIGTDYVEKIITIDTPHFGSGLGNASDKFDIAKLAGYYNPAVYDLDTESTLYGGKTKKWDWSLTAHRDTEYAINNQSPALKGNKNVDVKYYAVAGYDVGGVTEIKQLADGLENHLKAGGAFSVTFNRAISDKKALDSSINNKLNEVSKEVYGEGSKLDLGNADGDNTVDYMSQFAVRFGKNYDYQNLEKTTLIIATGYSKTNPYHNAIHKEKLMHTAVGTFVNS